MIACFEVDGITFTETLEDVNRCSDDGGFKGFITTPTPGNWRIEFKSSLYDPTEAECCGYSPEAYKIDYTLVHQGRSDTRGYVDEVSNRLESHRMFIQSFFDGRHSMGNRVMWFSRHEMTIDQRQDLYRIYGPVEIMQVDKTVTSAYELKDEIAKCQVIAVVAPLYFQEQFLKIADGKPVILCRGKNILVSDPDDGENKVEFIFDGWYQIDKIEIISHDL